MKKNSFELAKVLVLMERKRKKKNLVRSFENVVYIRVISWPRARYLRNLLFGHVLTLILFHLEKNLNMQKVYTIKKKKERVSDNKNVNFLEHESKKSAYN